MWINKITLLLALGSVGLCFGGMILAHLELVRPNTGGLLFALSALLGLGAFVGTAFVMFFTKNYGVALVGVAGLMPLVAVTTSIFGAFQHPRINDISTDLTDPPAYAKAPTLPDNAGRDFGFPPGNAALIKDHYTAVQPLALNLPQEQAYERALSVAKMHAPQWEITREDPANFTFEGIAITKMFRWRDDFVVRVRPAEGGGARVDMRSKSREGKSDLGANARRIEQFFAEIAKLDIDKLQ